MIATHVYARKPRQVNYVKKKRRGRPARVIAIVMVISFGLPFPTDFLFRRSEVSLHRQQESANKIETYTHCGRNVSNTGERQQYSLRYNT